MTVLADALEHLVRGIVDHPDDVRVDLVTTRRGRTLEVRVHPEDLGKVIGRGGRTATALRTVVNGIGGRGVRVDVVDTDLAAHGACDALVVAREHHDGPDAQRAKGFERSAHVCARQVGDAEVVQRG